MTKTRTDQPNICIGDTLYKTYSKEPYEVVGETSRSWLVRCEGMHEWHESLKVPKSQLPQGWFLDKQEWDDWWFWRINVYSVAKQVEHTDPQLLRKIAELIQYVPKDTK